MSADPYSASRIRRGAVYLVGGKAITAVAGVGTFLLLVRSLPVEQFAAYSILFGLVELVDAITGIGLGQILSRYVPELFVQHRQRALRLLVALALSLRIAVLTAFLAAIYALAPAIAPLIGLESWQWALQAYLAVVLVRVVANSLFAVLESMLHQAIAQGGFGLVTVSRFALVAAAASQGVLDLETVILIELVTDVVGLGVMLIGTMRVMPRRVAGPAEEGENWGRSNLRRMMGFGIKGYLQHLLIMPYGTSTNRLLVGGSLASGDVALFGFAQSVADLMERYLPVKLLAGVIRPVLTARFVRDSRFADLQSAANLIFKVNAVLICLAAVVVFSGGESMLSLATGGKYSENGVWILLVMCALVLMYSLRLMLDHVSHAVERNGPLIWSNAVITTSVLPGIALLPVLGVYALPVANMVGMLVGSWVLVWRLKVEGFRYQQDLGGLARLLATTALSAAIGGTAQWVGGGWILCTVVGVGAYLAFLFALRPITINEARVLLSAVARRSD